MHISFSESPPLRLNLYVKRHSPNQHFDTMKNTRMIAMQFTIHLIVPTFHAIISPKNIFDKPSMAHLPKNESFK